MLILIFCMLAQIAPVMAIHGAAALSGRLPANQKEILDAINACRRNVTPTATNILKVEWSKEAAATASNYSKTCLMKHSFQSQRILPCGCQCGENLYLSSHPVPWTEAILAFCNEKKDFIFAVGPKKKGDVTGHYTQTVWYSSYMVGGDVAYCPKQKIYKYFYVIHQCPGGNYLSSITKPYEAGKTCSKCKGKCDNGLCTNPCTCGSEPINCNDFKSYCSQPDLKEICPLTCTCTNGEIY